MLADILSIKMFETPVSFGMKENQYRYDLSIGKAPGFIPMDFPIAKLMFFTSEEKYLQKSSARKKISVILSSVIISVNYCKSCNWTL